MKERSRRANDARKIRKHVAKRNRARLIDKKAKNPAEKQGVFGASFIKGMPHNDGGMLDKKGDFRAFVDAIASGVPSDMDRVPIAGDVKGPRREWESPTAGSAFSLIGPDPQAFQMPTPPQAGSAELSAEMAEVYFMALDRDLPLAALTSDLPSVLGKLKPKASQLVRTAHGLLSAHADTLKKADWFRGKVNTNDEEDGGLRRRRRFDEGHDIGKLYRGNARGDRVGPYLSQFLLVGTPQLGDPKGDTTSETSGIVSYGAIRIDHRVREAEPAKDYMTAWRDWLEVQKGADVRDDAKLYTQPPAYRLPRRLRDLATYVHVDALYEAYLNACLAILARGFPVDPGLPFHKHSDTQSDRQDPFALYGGPHVLSLVTEVASRALKAVRHQKFGVHRRFRPEALGGRLHLYKSGFAPEGKTVSIPSKQKRWVNQAIAPMTKDPALMAALKEVHARDGGYLLPMAFQEGSPMHPAYGAGHATVAGACVTILKAFFAMELEGKAVYLVEPKKKGIAAEGDWLGQEHIYVPHPDEDRMVGLDRGKGLTLEGELNKLAANIAIARNIAGVHFFTDYAESLVLGENIALGILEDMMQTLVPDDEAEVTVPLFYKRPVYDTRRKREIETDKVVIDASGVDT